MKGAGCVTTLCCAALCCSATCKRLFPQVSAEVDRALGVEPVRMLPARADSKELERRRLLQVLCFQTQAVHQWYGMVTLVPHSVYEHRRLIFIQRPHSSCFVAVAGTVATTSSFVSYVAFTVPIFRYFSYFVLFRYLFLPTAI